MSGRIPQTFIQELIARTDIVEIIQTRVSLKKQGKNYQACCPFHDEKTPSFSVNQDKQFYYCFGCRAHGNVVNFLMQYDRMEFIDCIEYLANQLGVEIPRDENAAPQQNHKPLYDCLEKVTSFYEQQLRHAPNAITFLKKRGLTGQIAKLFRIGYAPPGWDNLLLHFKDDADAEAHLLATGMLIEKNDAQKPGCYDRFRNRVVFPIRNVRGKVIGFGGRCLDDQKPKYLNSPETVIFHKSAELYGLYEARQYSQQPDQFIITEGYMDVIGLAQHGIYNAVASLGTAVNSKHIQKLLRYANELVFCFDGDNAGKAAMWKALTICLPLLNDGIHIKFCYMPNQEDPDSWIQKVGRNTFLSHIKKAASLQDIFFAELRQQFNISTMDGKAHFAKQAKEHIATMPNGLYQNLMLRRVSEILNMSNDEMLLLEDKATAIPVEIPNTQRSLPAIYQAISILLHYPGIANEVQDLNTLFTLEVPGKNLLVQILMLLRKQPNISIGEILTHWDTEKVVSLVAELAARPLPISAEGALTEFNDIICLITKQHNAQIVEGLINKARQNGLSESEKQQLQTLLAEKQ